MDIPNVGTFLLRSGMAAVAFNEYLLRETKLISRKPVEERKQKGDMSLNGDSLRKFDLLSSLGNVYDDRDAEFLFIDEKAKEYMQRNLNINVDEIVRQRPATSASRSMTKLSTRSKPLADNWLESNVKQNARPATSAGKSKSVTKDRV